MKKYFIIFVTTLVVIPLSSFAQTRSTTDPVTGASCYSLIMSLKLGSTDAKTRGEVTVLQNFLTTLGYLTIPAGVSTGYYGSATAGAVRKFQKDKGIPVIGSVGPLTRSTINSYGCVGTFSNSPVSIGCGTPGAFYNSQTGLPCSGQSTNVSTDEQLKSTLSSMRAAAEIYYDTHNNYGPTAYCTSGMFTDQTSGMNALTQNLKSLGGVNILCHSMGSSWVASAPLSTEGSWCVDSTGYAGVAIVNMGAKSYCFKGEN